MTVHPRPSPTDTVEIWQGGDLAALLDAARAVLGVPVTRATAPGGSHRSSLRLHLADGRSLIGSHRPDPARLAREVGLMRALNGAGGHIPRCLGTHGPFLFQQDAGTTRLTDALAASSGAARRRLALAAIQSLVRLRTAAHDAGLLDSASRLALSPDWLVTFVTAPLMLAKALQLTPPKLDLPALATSLAAAPDAFVRWDARPGNAALGPGGRVTWFDWEDFGRRAGVEDIAMLIADEYWPLGPAETLAAVTQACPQIADLPLLTRFATLHICTRLLMILKQAARCGWRDADHLRRYDLVGVAPDLVSGLANRGAGYAVRHDLTRPMAAWFRTIETARWPVPAKTAA